MCCSNGWIQNRRDYVYHNGSNRWACLVLHRYKRTYKVQQDVCYREICEPMLPKKNQSESHRPSKQWWWLYLTNKPMQFFSHANFNYLNSQKNKQTTMKVCFFVLEHNMFFNMLKHFLQPCVFSANVADHKPFNSYPNSKSLVVFFSYSTWILITVMWKTSLLQFWCL